MASSLGRPLLFVVVLLALASPVPAAFGEDSWEPYRFLMGDWIGAGSGQPGAGEGRFSFATELQGKILVRKGRLDLTPAPGKKAMPPHEDLMVIYPGQGGSGTKAVYFDSEGHTINYRVSFSDDQKTLTFLSDAPSGSPTFRLTYSKGNGETVRVKFEIAPADKPKDFKTYMEGDARRTGPTKP
jgi:hypothetical protein